MPAIHALVAQLAAYERAAQEVVTTPDDYARDFAAGKFDAVVAEDTQSGKILGMGLYYIAYSTWKGQYLWLEDFVVDADHRGSGIGHAIFDTIADIAKSHNIFFKWQVLDWNEPAMRFYNRYPVQYEKEWVTCRWWLNQPGNGAPKP